MDEHEDIRDPDDRPEIDGDDAIGPLLRRLRGDLSLRDVTRRVGVSSSYLSQIERSDRKPGSNIIRKLADLYNVDADELLKRAGRDSYIDPFSDEAMEVERAYQYRAGRPRVPRGHPARRPHHPEDQAIHRRDVRAIRQQEAAGMNRTRVDFCHTLLDDHPQKTLGPETLAARFVRYFDVPARPSMEQLKALLKRTGFGEVSGTRHIDAKGIHYSSPNGGYDIHYREDLWTGSQDYSVIHETYEIVYETLYDMESGTPPDRRICRQAERFAAAMLMQPRAFRPLALEWGLDVLRLHRAFQCSYAAVAIRLAEVVRDIPLMTLLYETPDRRDPKLWMKPADLRVKVLRRTRDFGVTTSFLFAGTRGGIPLSDRPIPKGSLAEQAARRGIPAFGKDEGIAAIAQPVVWKGKLAKVVVVAVPERYLGVLVPQMETLYLGRRRARPMAAAAAAGPW